MKHKMCSSYNYTVFDEESLTFERSCLYEPSSYACS